MSGTVYLTPDEEPYESGTYEGSKTGITDLERYMHVHYCEHCETIVDTFEE